jgi:hypothetical protein
MFVILLLLNIASRVCQALLYSLSLVFLNIVVEASQHFYTVVFVFIIKRNTLLDKLYTLSSVSSF